MHTKLDLRYNPQLTRAPHATQDTVRAATGVVTRAHPPAGASNLHRPNLKGMAMLTQHVQVPSTCGYQEAAAMLQVIALQSCLLESTAYRACQQVMCRLQQAQVLCKQRNNAGLPTPTPPPTPQR